MGGLLAITGAACALLAAPTISLETPAVRISDIMTLDCVASEHRARVGAIALTSAVNTEVRLTRAAIVNLVRRNVPILAPALNGAANEIMRLNAPALVASLTTTSCVRFNHPVERGQIITAEHVSIAPCDAPVSGITVYDRRASVTRARRDISVGTHARRFVLSPAPVSDARAPLTLSVVLSPVRIERRVESLEPVHDGSRAFVRDEDGLVFPTPTSALSPADSGAP